MPSPNAKPIPNLELVSEIENFNYSPTSLNDYLETYSEWIRNSRHNNISGLDHFKFKSFIHGTIQCFDHFYLKHCKRRFRFYKGEFMYHRASMKYNLEWKYLNDSDLEKNDAVIISVPFSDTGSAHVDLKPLLERCEELKVPVLLDLAYLPIAQNINIDVNFSCIDSICTSLSKAFDGAQYIRAGIRLQRQNLDDGIDVFNSVNMVPNHSMAVAIHLMKKYSIDYNWNTYGEIYKEICRDLNLIETDCIIFGLSEKEYKEYNRGNTLTRVCIADDLSKNK